MDKDNPKKDGDEEGDNEDDFKDPAIISVVPPCGGLRADPAADASSTFRYSKDELLKLRKAPNSQKRPKCLEAAYYNQQGVWDPEPWHYQNKQADNQSENTNGPGGDGEGGGGGPSSTGGGKRNRLSDPRERIRKEQDGIVLSPQRRSFNSGCFVPVRETSTTVPIRPNRAHSPLGATGGNAKSDPHLGTRRIGSGRILPWDFQEKTEENDFGYRRSAGGGDRERDRERERDRDRDRDRDRGEREDRFERRSFGRDYDGPKEKHLGRSQGQGRGFNRRISNESREEEPEWFSSGPISQNDTIELRGFDDIPEKGPKKNNKQKKALNGDATSKKNEANKKKSASKESLIGKDPGSNGRGTPQEAADERKTQQAAPEKKTSDEEASKKSSELKLDDDENCFNFDAMFKADAIQIPGLLSNGIEAGDAAGSRFSRWFQRAKSPPTKADSRRSSLHEADHHHLIKNLLGESYNEPQVSIPQPGDAESYFVPISPAAAGASTNQHEQQQQQQKASSLMEMLQRGPAAQQGSKKNMESQPSAGKILSLEELEAKMRKGAPDKVAAKSSEDDINAFKRLFSQMNVNNGPMPPQTQPKPMSIMEMLSHSQQKDADAARRMHHHQHQQPQPAPPPQAESQMHPHVAFKLQQVHNQVLQQTQKQQQLEMLAKLFGHQTRASPLPDLAAGRELLNRPEAQAIMQGLKRGDITPQHLYQQLANPAMQPRHREMLHTILKLQQQQQPPPVQPPLPPQAVVNVGGMPPVVPPPSQPPPPQQQSVSPNFFNAQQQLRVSPLPNAYCVSPIMATSPNTLSVPALHQRIPSPRELQVHTQNIMQRALIKKKLEEQEENYRKKQQQQQQQAQQQQRGAAGSPATKTAAQSPTPLAFMPTSVMRKLTAEKEDASKDGKEKMPQGRPLTALRTGQGPGSVSQGPQPNMAQNWNNPFAQPIKQPGRPIVKANNYPQPNQPSQQHPDYFQDNQQKLRIHQQQQQQQLQQMHQKQNYYNHQQQHQGPGQYQQQQLSQQQLRQQHQNVRAQHQQQHPPNFSQQPPQQPPPQQQQQPPPQQQPHGNWLSSQGQNFDNHQMNRADLSPTSHQLARWFSPDLLERARRGNLPSIPASAVAQHALSLEDIERQTTPVGHN